MKKNDLLQRYCDIVSEWAEEDPVKCHEEICKLFDYAKMVEASDELAKENGPPPLVPIRRPLTCSRTYDGRKQIEKARSAPLPKPFPDIWMHPNVEFDIELEKPAPKPSKKEVKVSADKPPVAEKPVVAEKSSVENTKETSNSTDANRADEQHGMTLLHYAVQLGNWEWVSTLVEQGASIHVKDKWGRTPFDCAKIIWKILPKKSELTKSTLFNPDPIAEADLNEDWLAFRHYCNTEREKMDFEEAQKIDEADKRVGPYITHMRRILFPEGMELRKGRNMDKIIEKNRLKKVD